MFTDKKETILIARDHDEFDTKNMTKYRQLLTG